MSQDRFFCSQFSQASGERPLGSAGQTMAWLLLEHHGAWPRQVLQSPDLPDAVKAHLRRGLGSDPYSRFNFVKQPLKTRDRAPSLFVAIPGAPEPVVQRLQLSGLEDLLWLDLPALLRGDFSGVASEPVAEMVLVCTHGRHDACCARFGMPVHEAAAAYSPETVWQASHVGGDRFAANIVLLPSGVYYGHVHPGDAAALIDWGRAGALYLPRFRGRSAWPMPAQAAEAFHREATGETALAAVELRAQRRVAPGRWAVDLLDGGGLWRVAVARVNREGTRWLTCQENTGPVEEWVVEGRERVSPA